MDNMIDAFLSCSGSDKVPSGAVKSKSDISDAIIIFLKTTCNVCLVLSVMYINAGMYSFHLATTIHSVTVAQTGFAIGIIILNNILKS